MNVLHYNPPGLHKYGASTAIWSKYYRTGSIIFHYPAFLLADI